MNKSPRSPQHMAVIARRRKMLIAGISAAAAAIIVIAVVVPVTAVKKAAPAAYTAATPKQLATSGSSSSSPSSSAGGAVTTSSSSMGAATTTTTTSSSSSSNTSSGSSPPVDTRAAALAVPSSSTEAKGGAVLGPACNGIPGLCSIPLRYTLFLGTHNSYAIKTVQLFENQNQGFAQQLKDGVRLFDLDYSGKSGKRFAHCFDCTCGYANSAADAEAVRVFDTMGTFLDANPREVILLGMSNINCGDVAAARAELLAILAASPLHKHLCTQAIGAETTLGDLVTSGQRAVMVFYDQWGKDVGYNVGNKFIPPQPLVRYYGGNTDVGATGGSAIDRESAKSLVADMISQYSNSTRTTSPFRIVGMFPSTCFACRSPVMCGPISCAIGINRESFSTYLLGATTAAWLTALGSKELLPAFNGFQVDYYQQPTGAPGVLSTVNRVNSAWAWLQANSPGTISSGLGLGNCIWLLDDASYSGLLLCSQHGKQALLADAGKAFRVLLPATKGLRVESYKGGKVSGSIVADGAKVSIAPLAGPFDSLAVVWNSKKKKKRQAT